MSTGGLLNPPQHHELAQRMILIAAERLEKLDTKLTESVMDNELYLQTIGARKHLSGVIADMQTTYDNEVLK